MANLWRANLPHAFWLCQPDPMPELWQAAIQQALPILDLPMAVMDSEQMVAAVLGEEQFGVDRWTLSKARRLYYELKPLLPRWLIRSLRRVVSRRVTYPLHWPIEDRYVRFLWQVAYHVVAATQQSPLPFVYFWPQGKQFAFGLRHDIETHLGQAYVRTVADLDERYGFRSVFNFVAERYPLDWQLIGELRERGFEIGIHGLRHDGKDFISRDVFYQRAARVNDYLARLNSVTFSAPLTHRQPEWMQILNIEYDQSFFDTDPYEPIPGGVMTIWPFFCGRFVEIPYTLPQDSTVVMVLGHTTPDLWLQKIAFIENYHGMAILNSHPDYLREDKTREVYSHFLEMMQAKSNHWHALPSEIARWWRQRSALAGQNIPANALGTLQISGDRIEVCPPAVWDRPQPTAAAVTPL